MDKLINNYIESKVLEVLQIANFSGLTEDQKNITAEKIRDVLNRTILDTLIDNLTPDQLNQMKDIPADDPQMEDKIEEFASKIPLFSQVVEEAINQKISEIKNDPQILN